MKSLKEFINEWREDLGNQVIMIMGTPGCGKTYWMQHNGIRFFKSQGITLNPKELDIDHTLKIFQIIDFPKFCDRVINYRSTSVSNSKGDVHIMINYNLNIPVSIYKEMKKLLALIALIVFLTACEKETGVQKGIVIKTEANDTYGYKYRVEVINVTPKGFKP